MPDIKNERICEECGLRLPIEKFPRVHGDRRRHTCNRCTRGRKQAQKFGMSVADYLTYSAGPCVFCGDPETKAFFLEGSARPSARICGKHRMMFRAFRDFEELVLCHQILLRFPFWIDILRRHNLHLFRVDGTGELD